MKKLTLLAILAICSVTVASAQYARRLQLREFNTWSVQANGNLNWGNMDIAQNSPFYTGVSTNFGYGLRVNRFLTHNFGLSLDGYRSSLKGQGSKHSYDSRINYQVALLGQIQTGNIRFIDSRVFNNLQLYAYLGYGTLNFTSKSTKSDETHEGNAQVIPVGLGTKYRASDRITLNLEYCYNRVNGDLLDGYSDALTDKDNYSRISVGVSYTLGKEDNFPLEWHDPRPVPRPAPPILSRIDTVVLQPVYIAQKVEPTPNPDSIAQVEAQKISQALELAIYYEFNVYSLPKMYNSGLDAIARHAMTDTCKNIVIASYTDTIGSVENNEIIVKRRADQIKRYLQEVGVPENKIICILHDETSATGQTDADNRKSIVSFGRCKE